MFQKHGPGDNNTRKLVNKIKLCVCLVLKRAARSPCLSSGMDTTWSGCWTRSATALEMSVRRRPAEMDITPTKSNHTTFLDLKPSTDIFNVAPVFDLRLPVQQEVTCFLSRTRKWNQKSWAL